MRTSTLWAVAQLIALGSCSQWKQVLQNYNFPASRTTNDHMKYHVQTNPTPYAVIEETALHWKNLGAKRTEIKYGAFRAPSMMDQNGMIDYLQINTPMPCTDCMITYMLAGLEYPDGSYANANTSLWLHHVVMIDASSPDTVCGYDYYGAGERWFASGNERTPMDVSVAGHIPVGYYVKPNSYNIMILELMNAQMAEQEAVLTITYEYVPGKPENWFSARPVWLDIAGCHIPSDMPPKTNTTFTYEMDPPYKSKYEGAIVGQGGHIHDGGVNIEAYRNDTVMCDCVATYAESGGYMSPPGMVMGMNHCKNMGASAKSTMKMSMSMVEDMKSMSMPMKHSSTKMSMKQSSMKMSMKHSSMKMSMKHSSMKMSMKHSSTKMSMMHSSTKMSMKHSSTKMPMKHTSTKAPMPQSTGLTWCGGNKELDREHISQISTCYAPNGMIQKGDILKNKVWYDFNTHAPMLNTDGTIADIMGISLVYFAENMTMAEMEHFIGGK